MSQVHIAVIKDGKDILATLHRATRESQSTWNARKQRGLEEARARRRALFYDSPEPVNLDFELEEHAVHMPRELAEWIERLLRLGDVPEDEEVSPELKAECREIGQRLHDLGG